MIDFNNVSFSYGKKKVIDNLSFHINEGERVHIDGPSGKGKTTILRLIMSLEKPKSGVIKIKDGAKIAAVFQEDRLIPFISVKKNITLFSEEEKALLLLNKLGIGEYADALPEELSGGMKRRAEIARALALGSDIVIFDEAMNGIDAKNIKEVAEVIKEYTVGKTVITVTHHKKEAALIDATRIIKI